MKKIILHHHIFKNAGVSIDHSLKASFGERWRSIEGELPWSTISEGEIVRFIKANPNCCAISSHQARIIRNDPPDVRIFPVIFIRHPIDRVGSCYEYERAVNSGYHTSVAAQKGLKYYVDYCLGGNDQFSATAIKNYQTLHLSTALEGVADARKVLPNDSNLRESIAYLDELPAFGIVDEFEVSLQLFHDWLAPCFPEIKFEAIKLNASKRQGATVNEKIDRLRAEVGEELYIKIIDNNALDISLYEFAKKKFLELNRGVQLW